MTKQSRVFNLAWQLARAAAKEFGGSSRQYFPSALKTAYEEAAIFEVLQRRPVVTLNTPKAIKVADTKSFLDYAVVVFWFLTVLILGTGTIIYKTAAVVLFGLPLCLLIAGIVLIVCMSLESVFTSNKLIC